MSLLVFLALSALAQDPEAAVTAGPAPESAVAASATAVEEEGEAAPPTPSAPVPYQAPAYPASSVRPFEMPSSATPDGPVPYGPGETRTPAAPVTVDSYRRNYEGPLDGREQLYEAGVRRNFDAQQVRMGLLDGAWTVRTASGATLITLILNDAGRAEVPLEGAWRQPGAPGRSGFLVSASREGEALVIRWEDRPGSGDPATMRLQPQPNGVWRGVVRTRDVEYPVTMSRP